MTETPAETRTIANNHTVVVTATSNNNVAPTAAQPIHKPLVVVNSKPPLAVGVVTPIAVESQTNAQGDTTTPAVLQTNNNNNSNSDNVGTAATVAAVADDAADADEQEDEYVSRAYRFIFR